MFFKTKSHNKSTSNSSRKYIFYCMNNGVGCELIAFTLPVSNLIRHVQNSLLELYMEWDMNSKPFLHLFQSLKGYMSLPQGTINGSNI